MSESKFSCYLIGADTLLTQCGEILLEQGHTVGGVITDAPKVAQWARSHDIEAIAAAGDYAQILQGREFDYLFAITHLALIPDEAVTSPRKLAINFHDGPLPSYAGLNTPMWAIINGETEYGISWHIMASGIDEGDLLVQQHFPIAEDETALSLNTKCFAAALDTFPELIGQLSRDETTRTPQDLSQRTYYGRREALPQLGLLDWNRSASELAQLVRGLHVGPYENVLGAAKVAIGDRLYLVEEAVADVSDASYAPGTITGISASVIEVACAEGTLSLKALRSQSGEAQSIASVTSELGLREGLVFESSATGKDGDQGGSKIIGAESFWARRLRRVVAPDLPYREASVTSGTPSANSLALEIPEVFIERFGGQAIGPAFQVFLARVCAGAEVHCAIGLTADLDEAEQRLLSRTAFTRFTLDPASAATAELQRAVDSFSTTADKAPWLRDLIARSPDLRGIPMLGGTAPLAVAIEVPDRPVTEDAELKLLLNEGDQAELRYHSGAYPEAGIASLKHHFETMLSWFAEASDQSAAEISLLTAEEHDCLINQWNQTDLDYDKAQTIHGAFSAQVDRTPDAPALVANGSEVTYRELSQRVDTLAAELRGRGIGADTLVGVHVPRSIELVVAALGVMRAGGAYVPLDPAFPADRIAFMIEDSRMSTIISSASLRGGLPETDAEIIEVETIGSSAADSSIPAATSTAEDLAYVIYTSGSTGRPKGVMLEHRNATNFFAAMDERVPEARQGGVWLAVTSLSFDISILELFWTLTRGFKVVIYDEQGNRKQTSNAPISKKLDMGLFMWGNDDAPGAAKYRLLMEGSKYFDENGFSAVWTPERHFHAFGGPYPNPAVTGAAVAAITKNVKIRAGSCVVPLHHPVRIAEEWSVVDNLSDGRVELAAASGWNPNDFVLKPENHANNKQVMFDQLEQVRALWRGEKLKFPSPLGTDVEVESLPRPVQSELPCWITTAGNPDTWREAGKLGLNVLTHLLGQTVAEVGEKIRVYREARQEAGFDPEGGRVALMLHTFVGEDNDDVRELVREPMKSYLGSSMKLAMDFAWSFPAFKRPGGEESKPEDIDLKSLSDEEVDTILNFAFDRYFESSGLFGDVDTCVNMLHDCAGIGVDEIACLLDFGVETEMVMNSLPLLNDVRKTIDSAVLDDSQALSAETDVSFAGLISAHSVSHMQCTPSTARMLMTDEESRGGIAAIEHILLGGEALPEPLANELIKLSPGTLTNMYGPTETTIWSTTAPVSPGSINIGTPIANTSVYVLDKFHAPVPPGMPGELFIGGDGVARGYFNREALTVERFVPDPFADEADRMYATGDLVRWHEDGHLQYLGRTDFQVKVRGYRIELGEIEKQIEQLDSVAEAAVIVRSEDETDQRLVAFVVPASGASVDAQEIRAALKESLPDYMIPNEVVEIGTMPQTANAKLDRKALQAIRPKSPVAAAAAVSAESDLEKQIADFWCETLKIERVGVEDNFFDLGGHSLLVVQLHKKIRESVDQPVSLTDLYQFPTVRSLAQHMEGTNENSSPTKGVQRGERRRAMRRRGAR